MRIAITGGSGLIGSALAPALRTDGHEVHILRRGIAGAPDVDWDGAGGWIREGTFEGVDAVVHLSGASIGDGRWTDQRKAVLRSSRIETTRALVSHLGELPTGPGVFVCASAVGYYGDAGERRLTEGARSGEGFLPSLVRDWEAEAMRAEALGLRTVVTRNAVVLSALLPRLIGPFKLGLGGPLGGGRQWFPWVALDDVVRAIQFVLANEISGPVNVAATGEVTQREFARALGRALRRPAFVPLPAFAARLAFGRERANQLLLLSQRVVPQRLTDAGFDFDHPYLDTALAAALRRADEGGRLSSPTANPDTTLEGGASGADPPPDRGGN